MKISQTLFTEELQDLFNICKTRSDINLLCENNSLWKERVKENSYNTTGSYKIYTGSSQSLNIPIEKFMYIQT